MAEAVSAVVSAMSSVDVLFRRASVAGQAGILEGANPTKYDPKNPITLFIIQVSFQEEPYDRSAMARPVGTVVSLSATPCRAVIHRSSPRSRFLYTTGYACIRKHQLTIIMDRRVSSSYSVNYCTVRVIFPIL